MSDPISDMLTRIRNGLAVKKQEVVLPYSNAKFAIAKILEKESYVASVEKKADGKFPQIRIALKYEDGKPVITMIKRVSKPGLRVYAKSSELPRVVSGYGIAIISTPNGMMTNKEARARRLGGEVVCEIV